MPPGRYRLAFHLDGKTYRFPLEKYADPLSTTPQSEYQEQFAQSRRVYDLLGRIDTMLNELDRVRQLLVADKTAIKTGNPTATANIQAASEEADAILASLTSSPANFEDFIQKPGQLREDVLGLMNQEPLAQASLQLYASLERTYTAKASAYNQWARKFGAINSTLKTAGLRTIAKPAVVPH